MPRYSQASVASASAAAPFDIDAPLSGDDATIQIFFCGRPARSTGVVNLRLLLGDHGYVLTEKRRVKEADSVSTTQNSSNNNNNNNNNGDGSCSERKSTQSSYRLCASDGLPDGCFRVKHDRHYWVMRMGEDNAQAHTPSPRATEAQLSSPSLPSIPVSQAQTAEEKKKKKRHGEDDRSSTDTKASNAKALAKKSETSKEKRKRPASRHAEGEGTTAGDNEEEDGSPHTVTEQGKGRDAAADCDNPLSEIFKAVEAAGTAVATEGTSLNAPPLPIGETTEDIVGDVEATLGDLFFASATSPLPTALETVDITPLSPSTKRTKPRKERRQEEEEEQREKVVEEEHGPVLPASRKHPRRDRIIDDALVAEEKEITRQRSSANTPAESNDARKEVVSSSRDKEGGNMVEEVSNSVAPTTATSTATAAESQPSKRAKKEKPKKTKELATTQANNEEHQQQQQQQQLDAPVPATQTSTHRRPPRPSPSPSLDDSPLPRHATPPPPRSLPSMSLPDDVVAAKSPHRTPPAPANAQSTGEEAVQQQQQQQPAKTLMTPPRAARNGAMAAADVAQTSQQQQQQRKSATRDEMRSPAIRPPPSPPVPPTTDRRATSGQTSRPSAPPHSPATSITSPTVLYSNRSSGTLLPPPQQAAQQPVRSMNSGSTGLAPLTSPHLRQHQQQFWQGDGSGSANAGSMQVSETGSYNMIPQDSPALGFTTVHNTLAEEFSLDPSETGSSSTASEYLYDVEG